jgi:predicted CXXCH cytochrome family protein
MFRFNGGQVVTKGTYWNLSNGEGISAEREMVLPGDSTVNYLKIPTAGIFLLGPLSGLLFVCLLPLMSMLMVVTLMARSASASDALKSEEAAMCMGCHANQGVVKTFTNKEKLSVQISDSHFNDSVHGFLTCTSCHSSVSMDSHPSAQYASRKAFAAQVSIACKQCHGDEQLMAKPMHRQAITRSNAPPCSDCHGSHAIRKTARWKESASNAQYCLTCHKKDLSLSLNGETLSLSINEATLRKSVHSGHECSQCHDEYSKKNHPLKSFKNRRELSIALSGVCSSCHTEKYKQHQGSMHTSMLMQGNRNAPVCTDCHGAHAVGPKAMAETLSGTPCRKCHESTFQAYQSSVHGQAKMSGNTHAPICSSCHSAHEVRPALASRSPKATCFGCHKEAAALHKEWLPNAEMHLEAIACTACHVPEAEHTVYLRITDNKSGASINKANLKEFLGPGYDDLTSSKKNGLEGQHLWDAYQKLEGNKSAAGFTGTLGLQDGNKSHNLAGKKWAVKQCDSCHDANSKFFKTVAMAIIAPNGHEEHYAVNRAVLGSVITLLPINHFYVLGSTRVRLLDILGILMVFGGMSVPLVHMALRILTIPIREAKRMNKLRKEGRR